MAAQDKEQRIWKPVSFGTEWAGADTSILDDIAASWHVRRKELEGKSKAYAEFLEQLKREHAIETGIVERLYDLEQGITETFIKEGFHQSYLSHGDTNIPDGQLMRHLKDHFDAVDFVFDVVGVNRELTTGFIKELHALVTRHQDYTEGIDQFGNPTKIQLLKGDYKKHENNPTRNGVKALYCPPVQVDSEMEQLVNLYGEEMEKGTHPLIVATWFHHAFTTIHPFQDGNGRVARLLASLIFIKAGYFPFTVLRQESRVRYIDGLEAADEGNPQPIVEYFAQVQRRNIEKALRVPKVAGDSLLEVAKVYKQKIKMKQEAQKERSERIQKLTRNKVKAFRFLHKSVSDVTDALEKQLSDETKGVSEDSFLKVKAHLKKNSVPDTLTHFLSFQGEDLKVQALYSALERYSKNNSYDLGSSFGHLVFQVSVSIKKIGAFDDELHFLLHPYGLVDHIVAIAPIYIKLVEEYIPEIKDNTYDFEYIPLGIPPHIISIEDGVEGKEVNLRKYIEQALTVTLARIASDL